jgi:Ca2+-binding EF-hand superfamily protein
MTKRYLIVALIVAAFAAVGVGLAQKQPVAPKPPEKATLVDENVKEMLLLMDTDKSGKISKNEWMKFMSAEFDRLDKDKSGELDPKELGRASISFRHFRFADQGK